MGYLTDNVTPGKPFVECLDIYPFRLEVSPGFAETREINAIIREQITDVEDWQFQGRRKCPPLPPIQRRRPQTRVTAQDSLFVRRFTEVVRYAFRNATLRDQAQALLNLRGFTTREINEPSDPNAMVIIVP